jgi:hypothetical protein
MTGLQNDVQALQTAYTAFFEQAQALPDALKEAPDACGHWSPKEILAHMCGWVTEAQRRFKRYPAGTGDMQYHTDAINEVFVWQRRDQSYDDCLADLRDAVQTLISMTDDIPEHHLARDENRYREWLVALRRDADHHRQQLEAFAADDKPA